MSGCRYTVLLVSGIRTSLAGRLARMGLADVPRAERMLAEALASARAHLPPRTRACSPRWRRLPNPDLALGSLCRVAERDRAILAEARLDASFRERLIAALGASAALADHLARHPADRAVLRPPEGGERPGPGAIRAQLLRAVGADPDARGRAEPRASERTAWCRHLASVLAAAYHRRLLHLAARDLTGAATR